MKTIYYINTLRVIATLAVVFLHTGAGIFETTHFPIHDETYHMYNLYIQLMRFSIPLFVLISGALFLSPNKNISFNLIANKYVKRIILALIVFGLPMCIIEELFTNTHETPLWHALINWITGNSWANMWYLYMLIGLYFLTPLIKPFTDNASNSDIIICLIVLFILSSLLPTIRAYGYNINSYMLIGTPYIFIYILGHYIQWGINIDRKHLPFYFILFLICLFIIVLRVNNEIKYVGYMDPITIAVATLLFIICKASNINWKFANYLNPYCFSIYLVHTIFTNLLYKGLKIEITDYFPVLYGVPLFFIVIIISSFILSYYMHKILILKKNIL